MAAIFQIRRGLSNVSLTEGELYLHQGSGSLQFGSGSNAYNTLTLNAPVKGNINLIGNISASGDVRIGGNIYLGDGVATDNISALGVFTTNLVPTGLIDLGTTSAKWNNVFANNITGAIAATNGVVSGSLQVIGILTSLNAATESLQTFTSSQEAKDVIIGNYTSSMNTFTASVNGHISDINTWSASVKGHIVDINTKTGSFETKFTTLQTLTASVQSQLSDIQSYTSSLRTAITASGTNVTINGDLTVKGTNTFINSTTIQLGDNIIELNGTGIANGGLLVKDPTGASTISGSLLWDSTNDYWKGGILGSEEKLLRAGTDGVISGSLLSLNTYTGSQDTKNSTLATYTASLEIKNSTLASVTGSLITSASNIVLSSSIVNTKFDTLGTYTASLNGHITDINTKTGSFETNFSQFNSFTASNTNTSLNAATSSYETRGRSIVSGSSQLTASYDTRYTLSGSILTAFSTSVDYRLDEVEYTASLFGGGLTAQLDKINQATASLQSKTGSYATTGSNSFNGSQEITGSLLVSQNITGSASASFVSLAVNTSTPSQKIHLKGAVGIENGTTGGATADQLVFGYNGSGLTQYVHKIQTGHDAQAGLNRMDFLIANSSNTTKTPLQLRHDRVIISGSTYVSGDLVVTGSINGTINATNGVVSGSSQVNFTQLSGISNGIVSGSSQTIANLPAGTVSGSIQVLGSSTIMSGSTNNYQFNSIGVGSTTAASGVNGEIRAQGDITAYYSSDERLKENIQPIVDALSKVESISGNTYDWKEGFETIHSHTGHDIGVIAQEIEKVLPEVVTDRETGYKAVQYEKIVPLLIEAIKELSAKVKELESK